MGVENLLYTHIYIYIFILRIYFDSVKYAACLHSFAIYTARLYIFPRASNLEGRRIHAPEPRRYARMYISSPAATKKTARPMLPRE